MPRYFFHVVNSQVLVDHSGTECASIEAARAEAIRAAGDMLKEMGGQHWHVRRWYMFVTDEANRTRLKLAFNVEDFSDEA